MRRPSPLVTFVLSAFGWIIVLTALSMALGLDVRTVGDMGQLPDTLPVFLLPDVPFTFETLQIIFPYSLAVAVVGLIDHGSSRHRLKITRPTAAGVELVDRGEQRLPGDHIDVDPRLVVVPELAGERAFLLGRHVLRGDADLSSEQG